MARRQNGLEAHSSQLDEFPLPEWKDRQIRLFLLEETHLQRVGVGPDAESLARRLRAAGVVEMVMGQNEFFQRVPGALLHPGEHIGNALAVARIEEDVRPIPDEDHLHVFHERTRGSYQPVGLDEVRTGRFHVQEKSSLSISTAGENPRHGAGSMNRRSFHSLAHFKERCLFIQHLSRK